MNKYGAKKCVVDGYTFDSQREARRYGELKLLEQAGDISGLALQVPFVLASAIKLDGRRKPALRYYADFAYLEKGALVVEDVKGVRTPVYKIKRHLMATVHGIEVEEI